jgi:hypothetical protein
MNCQKAPRTVSRSPGRGMVTPSPTLSISMTTAYLGLEIDLDHLHGAFRELLHGSDGAAERLIVSSTAPHSCAADAESPKTARQRIKANVLTARGTPPR